MPNAIILAAGRGQRLRPLTDITPKPLLYVGQFRLIEYHLFALAKANVKRVVINIAHLSEQFEHDLGDGTRYGIEIIYSYEQQALETGGGIFQALPLLGSDPFIVVNGDIWTDYDFKLLPEQPKYRAHLILVKNSAYQLPGDFGLDEQGFLIEHGQKYTYSGIGVYTPGFFKDCQLGHFSLTPLIRQAIPERQVTGEKYLGYWIDIGTKERLETARSYLNLRI